MFPVVTRSVDIVYIDPTIVYESIRYYRNLHLNYNASPRSKHAFRNMPRRLLAGKLMEGRIVGYTGG